MHYVWFKKSQNCYVNVFRQARAIFWEYNNPHFILKNQTADGVLQLSWLYYYLVQFL